jgi:hypothetical protein
MAANSEPPKIHPSFSSSPLRGHVGGNQNIARRSDETEPVDISKYPVTIMPPNGRLPNA